MRGLAVVIAAIATLCFSLSGGRSELRVPRTAPLQPAIHAVLKKVLPSVVAIRYGEKSVRHVSGVVVQKDGLVVTCGHVPWKVGEVVEICFRDKKTAAGKVLSKHGTHDLALVQIAGTRSWPAVEVGTSGTLTARDPVLAVGFPRTGLYGPTEAELLCYVRLGFRRDSARWERKEQLSTTVLASASDSGGPLFDLNGSLVGVCTSGDGAGRRTCYVPADDLVRAWKELAGDRPALSQSSARRAAVESPEGTTARGVRAVRPSVVEIRSDNRHWSGLGTYVGDGLIVTKASELRFGRDLSVVLNDGLVAGATVAATDPTLDLALVQLWAPKFADGITPICWAEAKHLLVGTIVTVVTPPAFSEPKGIVCVPSRAIPRLPGIVPVQVKDAEGGVEITATFVEITDSLWLASPPFNLRRGDVITNVGGVTVANRAAFAKLVFNEARIGRHPRAAGELVTVTYRRQGKEEVAFVHLRHAHSVPTQRIHPSSYRYSSFPAAIASDLNARPEHCGAPVVDAEGRVVGLLIAQAPFIESLILPSTEVSAVVKAMRRSVTKKK